jgi:hypothetical protein
MQSLTSYQNNPIVVHKTITLEQMESIENKRENNKFKLLFLHAIRIEKLKHQTLFLSNNVIVLR